MSVYFAAIGSGFGDIVVCLPALQYLIKTESAPVFLVARSLRQLGFEQVIPGLAGTVRETELPALLDDGDKLINLREHELQKNWDWLSPEFRREFPAATNIWEIMNIICQDFGILVDFDEFPKLPHKNVSRCKNKILLAPGTTSVSKHLAPLIWISLVQMLKEQALEFAVVGEPEHSSIVRELIAAGVEHISTPTVETAVDVISSARLLVSVDTGLAHLAILQGTRAVRIIAKSSLYFRKSPNCLDLFPSEEVHRPPLEQELVCRTKYDFAWWDGQEQDRGEEISSVSEEQILQAIELQTLQIKSTI